MSKQSSKVELVQLSKSYGHVAAVDKVSLDIAPGSLVAFLGPSGCGKTTCLRMMAGLVDPTSGEILVNGKSITRVPVHRRNMGMLFQNYALFPHLTVEQNVMFGLTARGTPRAVGLDKAHKALSLVQLMHLKDRYPAQLSGGQQQRVALARAIVIEPSMLLLDEPLGALDKNLRENMQVELRNLQTRLGITTVMVTHDQDEALTMADQIVIMSHGKLEQIASPSDIYQRPKTLFVASFIGASNLMSCTLEGRSGAQLQLRTAGGISIIAEDRGTDQKDLTVSVRPEEISLAPVGNQSATHNTVTATVEQVIYRGFARQYFLKMDDGTSLITFDQSNSGKTTFLPDVGSRVQASWSTLSNHLIPEKLA